MKRIVSLAAFLGIAQACAITKEEVKELAYQNQTSLMGEVQYKKFIDPYLDEAYKNLKIVHYCFDNDTDFSRKYMQQLGLYAVALFIEYAFARIWKPSPIAIARGNIRYMIEEYKNTIDGSLNAREELEKTIELFERANKDYYQNLGIMKRLYLWGNRTFEKTKLAAALFCAVVDNVVLSKFRSRG